MRKELQQDAGARHTGLRSTSYEDRSQSFPWTRWRRIPAWKRVRFIRKTVTIGCVILSVFLIAQEFTPQKTVRVLVAAHDIRAGHVISPHYVALRQFPPSVIPHGALHAKSDISDALPSGPIREGEIITDARLVRSRITEAQNTGSPMGTAPIAPDTSAVASAGSSAGSGTRVVAIPIDNPDIAALVHPGEFVDIISAAKSGPRVLAENALVVTVTEKSSSPRRGVMLLLSLPKVLAETVAAASLNEPLTLTFR